MRIWKKLIGLYVFTTLILALSITASAKGATSYSIETEQGYIYERKDTSAFMKLNSFKTVDSPTNYHKGVLKPMLYNASELESITTLDNVKQYSIYTYVIENGEITIIGCENTTSSITIPDYIRGYAVTKIDDFAFEWCDAIPSIHIPDSITSIGKGAFRFCLSLKEVVVSDEHPSYKSVDGILYSKDKSTLICFPANASVGSGFLPDELTQIDDFAFWGSNINNISISEDVSYIGDGAFGCCASLDNINVSENNEKYISVDGVLYNREMNEILCMPGNANKEILDTVTTIGAYSFCGDAKEMNFSFPNVSIVEEYAFAYCENIQSIKFGDALEELHKGAFLNCYYVNEIYLSDGVSSIGEECFWYCQYIPKIVLGPKIEDIPDSAFGYCLSLTKCDFNENVTSIGEYAFLACEALEEIKLNCVVGIGKGAFSYCVSISEFTIPSTTKSIGEYAMYWCNSVESIQVDEANYYYSSVDGNLFDKSKSSLIQYALWSNRESYSIPDGTKTIKKSAFENAAKLTQITLPGSIKTIEADVFEWCDNLSCIYYDGTESQFYSIVIHSNPFLKKINIVFNVEEEDDETPSTIPILQVNNYTAAKNQIVDVSIELVNNPGVALVSFTVDYDKEAMTLESATLGDIFTGELDCNLSAFPFVFNVYSGSENKTVSGNLVTLQFKIADDCLEGEYHIELSDIELINIDEESVHCEYTNGTIQVRNVIFGDVTNDGLVEHVDLLRLAKHFSGYDVVIHELAADVNGDGEVNRTDLLRLAKYFSGFDVILGK